MACQIPLKYFPIRSDVPIKDEIYKNKLIFITGGGTGLGKSMSYTFSQLGGIVIIASRKLDVLEKTAAEISKVTGNKVIPIQIDIRCQKSVKEGIDKIEKMFERLPDVVINNATGNFISPTERLSSNAIRTIVDIVLLGTVNVTLEIGKRIIKSNKNGCVFAFVSALYATSTAEFCVPSGMAKAGIENLSRSLASEWGKYGMRFNVISPGPIPTDGAFGNLSFLSKEETIEMASKRTPIGRVGSKEEFANLMAYICSDYCSYMSGAYIAFDGASHLFGSGSSISAGELHKVSNNEWNTVEEIIKSRSLKNKV
ncbi:2,4-dienoyl-CoA reductase, mitochondrial [Strongyloides ratti]|uniref:2,4-dienoyl-CoA reductase, mitochondrial n=1 Tax=Strongyloides ratti TaxID=34506 RepID=A0A090L5M5_STRRB|nr:2,4-dienoyl-CoA reductase, mitochondrial [Strongyloides ratti]CEF63417.1 2,4-dienoyl-CoA reductase, mitochondrial [Strongyloides ratti]